jgi:glycosyltransferase involved in cell wall biosynthesis
VSAVTVVIPTIPGREHLLERAQESVRAQTLQPLATLTFRDEWGEGAAATRNRALKWVRTPLVAFLDDDDELYPNHLERCVWYADARGADVVYPGYDVVGGEDEVRMFGVVFSAALLLERNFIPVTTVCRTEAVRAAGGFQPHPDEFGNPCEDWGLWLAMVGRGADIAHLAEKTWRWHRHDGQTAGKAT